MSIDLGLIGGYNLDKILENKKSFSFKTKFGKPSSKIYLGEINNKKIALILRHGKKGKILPHQINHLANIYSFYQLKVKKIIAICAAGSLKREKKPADFVFLSDFIWLNSKPLTFKKTKHLDLTNPFSENLRKKLIESAQKLKIRFHQNGVYWHTLGPRFETKAEIKMMKNFADLVGMTNAPEVILANELKIEIATVAIVSNYACGISKKKISYQEVEEIMAKKQPIIKKLIYNL